MTDKYVFGSTGQRPPVVLCGVSIEDAKLAILKHRLTVADYHKMGEAGIFGEDARGAEIPSNIGGRLEMMLLVRWR
jgi:hypothetical protein